MVNAQRVKHVKHLGNTTVMQLQDSVSIRNVFCPLKNATRWQWIKFILLCRFAALLRTKKFASAILTDISAAQARLRNFLQLLSIWISGAT